MAVHRIRSSGVSKSAWRAGALAAVLVVLASGADGQSLTRPPLATLDAAPALEWSLMSAAPAAPAAAATQVVGRGRRTLIVGASVSSIDFDDIGSDDRILEILALAPRVAVGFRATDRVGIEIPFSVRSEKEENDDRFTEIEIGVRPVVAVYGSDAVSGVITLMTKLNRQSFGDDNSTRIGWEVGAGPEFRLNDALSFRGTLVYGALAEDEDLNVPKQSYFGLNLDLVHDLTAPGPREAGGFILRTGAAFTSVSPDEDDEDLSLLEIPSPYIGGYFNIGDCDCLRVGGELEFARVSQGDFSQSELTLLPTIEYDVVPADRLGFRIRGFGLLSRESFDSGSFDRSGTITGFGGGGAAVFPLFNRYRGVLGFDFLKSQENEDLGFPSANVIRITASLELPND